VDEKLTVDDCSAALVIRDLVAAHARRPVLRGITARVPRARITAVVGPNGAGKSTLLDVIAGVHAPVSGSVERAGVRGRPAYVVQRSEAPDVLPITVRAAVAMGRWSRRGLWRRLTAHDWSVVDECMARLGIQDLAYNQLGALSAGQRQRALVAQGLAQEADLLLLDEPAAGLDFDAQRSIDEAIRHARSSGVTVLRVTHDLRVAEPADHCLLLHRGTVVAAGPPAVVLIPDVVARTWSVPHLG
jgi:zinc/manganese transport system ATP-binding protein